VILTTQAWGQGCSDAGFCTMGAMKPDQPFNKKIPVKLRSMELSFYRGTTTLTPVVYVATADMSFSIFGDKNAVQIKIPFQATDGNFGGASSLSDISLCFTRNLFTSEKFDVNFSVGGKIPSNDSNLKEDGRPLPMYYQTSLGTYDFITGISFISRKWLFATGIQHPFNQNNNQFVWSEWNPPVYPSPEYVSEYDKAYKLKRGTDVMLRVERNFRLSRFNFTLGLLPIYRITKDEIEDPAGSGIRVKQDGTTGLALSAITSFGYSFNVRSGVRLLLGRKLKQRDVNPDGLTREQVTSITYYYRF
ncbi:MAG: hypothetical protein HC811_11530, partial [Flammeovirgaceae bacterium]|nr:hypothetical protein [Flammeovirgaceae bacterium]